MRRRQLIIHKSPHYSPDASFALLKDLPVKLFFTAEDGDTAERAVVDNGGVVRDEAWEGWTFCIISADDPEGNKFASVGLRRNNQTQEYVVTVPMNPILKLVRIFMTASSRVARKTVYTEVFVASDQTATTVWLVSCAVLAVRINSPMGTSAAFRQWELGRRLWLGPSPFTRTFIRNSNGGY